MNDNELPPARGKVLPLRPAATPYGTPGFAAWQTSKRLGSLHYQQGRLRLQATGLALSLALLDAALSAVGDVALKLPLRRRVAAAVDRCRFLGTSERSSGRPQRWAEAALWRARKVAQRSRRDDTAAFAEVCRAHGAAAVAAEEVRLAAESLARHSLEVWTEALAIACALYYPVPTELRLLATVLDRPEPWNWPVPLEALPIQGRAHHLGLVCRLAVAGLEPVPLTIAVGVADAPLARRAATELRAGMALQASLRPVARRSCPEGYLAELIDFAPATYIQ